MRDYLGEYYDRVMNGDTKSLDYSSYHALSESLGTDIGKTKPFCKVTVPLDCPALCSRESGRVDPYRNAYMCHSLNTLHGLMGLYRGLRGTTLGLLRWILGISIVAHMVPICTPIMVPISTPPPLPLRHPKVNI